MMGRVKKTIGALPALMASVPAWAGLVVGAGAAVLGVLLVTRPLTSVTVLSVYLGLSCVATGLGELTTSRLRARAQLRALLGVGWVVLGVVILAGLGRAIALLPLVLGIGLAVSGVLRWLSLRGEGSRDRRTAAMLLGFSDLGFGALAVTWPDVTLIVVSVLFGARTFLFGLIQAGGAVARLRDARRARSGGQVRPRSVPRESLDPRRGGDAGASKPVIRGRMPWRTIGAATMAVIASVLVVTSGRMTGAAPEVDAFYAAPAQRPAQAGALVRSEPFTREIPAGAQGWRILYTTEGEDGEQRLGSAIVVVPQTGAGDWPVVAWAHGTTGYATPCAPSVLDQPFTAGAMTFLPETLAEGWAVVAADYLGLGTAGPQPYLIGGGEARSVLDAVRAARQLDDARLGHQTVVWGHSQGGHAALWTGQLQPSYAPDVPLSGVAAMAPASDAPAIAAHLPDINGGSVFASYLALAYAETYADIDLRDWVIGAARPLIREMGARCLSEPGVLVSVLSALAIDGDRPIFSQDPTTGALGARLDENVPAGPFGSPLVIAQGGADTLITREMQDAYVARLCSSGQALAYRVYDGYDHMGVVTPPSPLPGDLREWTRARFDGEPQANTCG